MLEEIRRPIRIDDWNRMVDEFSRLEKRVKALEDKIPEPEKEWVNKTYDKFLVKFDEFFKEPGDYVFDSVVNIVIEDKQTYQYLQSIYVFDKQMMKDIEQTLSEDKWIVLTVNIKEKEITQKKVAIKKDVVKVNKEEKPKKQSRKNKWWFGL